MTSRRPPWLGLRAPHRHRPPAAGLALAAPLLGLLLSGCGASGGTADRSVGTPPAPASNVARAGAGDAGDAQVNAASAAARAPAGQVAPADRPVRIAVPSIGVDSPLVDLGLAKDGSIEVPADAERAGWFDAGPAPGQQGPAVIAGHVDSKTGPAVFYRLVDLRPGARIEITTAAGRTVQFRVSRVQRYPKTSFPTAAVYGPVPGPVLRLITCGGQFDRSTGHYRDNVVVYAS